MARPLNGSAHAGEGADDGAEALLALVVGLARLREQKGEGKWELGFRPSWPGCFDQPEWPLSRRIGADGEDCAGYIAA